MLPRESFVQEAAKAYLSGSPYQLSILHPSRRGPPPSGGTTVGLPQPAITNPAITTLPRTLTIIKYSQEDVYLWETPPPAIPPFRIPPRMAAPLVFHSYVCFSLHCKHNLIGSSEKRAHKNVRN